MGPYSRIDAQFNRAVEIVQNLPKTGPIQTGYEDKLNMYSLYKQATAGNSSGPRPAVWEILPRAKWDAWAKHKDMDSYEAKRLYVDALLKVLRRYSDKTIAMDYVRELESYYTDPTDLVMSGSFTRSRRSSSSSSGSSQPGPSGTRYAPNEPAYMRGSRTDVQRSTLPTSYARVEEPSSQEETTSASEEEDEAELADQVRQPMPPPPPAYPPVNRPQSSLSSKRYRTPMASMLMSPPPASLSVPPSQPMPRHETPSAYADVGRASPSTYPTTSVSYPPDVSQSSRTDIIQSPELYRTQSPYRPPSQQPQYTGRPYPLQPNVAPRPVLERAVENVQTHLAALTERIESLENMAHRSTSSLASQGGSRSPRWMSANRGASPLGRVYEHYTYDDMGMWSLVLNPLSVVAWRFRRLMEFLMYNENRSPTLVVVRRLMLDISFLLCVLAVMRFGWRRSGVRRREVLGALRGLWYALAGKKAPRVLVDRAV